MDLHELRVAARLIDGLAKRALFAEKQMVALEGQCAEWKRIADTLKGERNVLRSTTIDTATGRLLDAFGSLANEPRNGATDDEYRDRIVRKIHSIKMERDALRAEIDNLTTPCDPPGSTHAEPDLTQLHAKGKEAWSDVPNATQWVEDMRGNTEASHDTPAGKEAAEAVVRDSQMTDTHDCGPNCPHCSW